MGIMPTFKQILGNISITQPAERSAERNGEIIVLPRNSERLRADIVTIQNELVIAQTEQVEIERARMHVMAEIQEALDGNIAKQAEIMDRLNAKRALWVELCNEVGVKAEVVRR